MILTFEEEFARQGNFKRIYPLVTNVKHLSAFFDEKRYENEFLSRYLTATDSVKQSLIKAHKRIYFTDI